MELGFKRRVFLRNVPHSNLYKGCVFVSMPYPLYPGERFLDIKLRHFLYTYMLAIESYYLCVFGHL